MSSTRLLVLGVDAASPELIRRWTAAGRMPNLARLIARGRFGECRSVDGFFVGSTWPSLYTGVTPARHGLHYLRQLEVGSYRFYRPADRGMVRVPPFWDALSAAGRRVAILDVPLAPIASSINGLQLVEWGGHDVVYGLHATPPDALALAERQGPYPLEGPCDRVERSLAGYRRFLDALLLAVERKTALTVEVLERGGWDLVMQVYTEAHCAGHQCWHLHDAAHPAHDPELAAALGDPLERVYGAIDLAIGELLARVPDADVMVLAGHGMGHWHGAHFLLRDLLVGLGFAAAEPKRPEAERGAMGAAAARAWRTLPEGVRVALGPLRRRVAAPATPALPTLGVDPLSSRCLPQPNGLAVSGVRLNLRGREPEGLVEPGEEAEATLEALERELGLVIDQRTGRPAFRAIWRPDARYRGDALEQLPDLLLEWSDEVATGTTALADGRGARVRLASPALGIVEGVNDYGRTGEHRPTGWLAAAGPGIAAGPLGPASVIDVAPTIARLLGVELAGVDGHPIETLVPVG
ncbi:MAG: alkaline phosphatase family protein [Gemmatimonadales bacterium]